MLIGDTIEAGADLGGMAAAINLFLPLPIPLLVAAIGSTILALQIFGAYGWITVVAIFSASLGLVATWFI